MLRYWSLINTSKVLLPSLQACRPYNAGAQGEPEKPHDSSKESHPPLAVVRQPTGIGRWLDAGLLVLHKLLKMITLRGSHAPELYVRRMLEEEAGLDPFAVDYIALKSPQLLSLSWQRDMQPVLDWLHSQGLDAADVTAVITACPAILAKDVDEQLQPLAELVEALQGCSRAVLLQYPAIAEVSVEHLRGTLHVLRQLGTTEAEAGLLLARYPDMFAQLARTLHQLFQTYGRLALKAYIAERRQYAGLVVEGAKESGGRERGGESVAGQQPSEIAAEREGPAAAAGEAAAGQGGDGGGSKEGEIGDDGQRLAVGLEATQFVCDSDVAAGLRRLQEALSALAMLPEEGDDHAAALSELQVAIDRLGNVEGVCLRQD